MEDKYAKLLTEIRDLCHDLVFASSYGKVDVAPERRAMAEEILDIIDRELGNFTHASIEIK